MPDSQEIARKALLDALLSKVEQDTYPSSTMLDTIESLLTPDDVERYSALLVAGIEDSQFPSISIIKRLQALAGAD